MATCPTCDGPLDDVIPGWCPTCATGHRVGAEALLSWLVDDAKRLPAGDLDADPLGWPDYPARRREARQTMGTDEAVVTVEATITGSTVRAVLVVWEFGFLGGSMSSGAGRLIAAAYDHAREAGLPIVLLPSTGGARMQEGMASLVQMAATSVAAMEHAAAGLLQVTVLRDPTTGGVFASHANLSDVMLAEPHATIGFAGPRVAASMTGGTLPEGSHTSQGALAAGLVDAIVPRPALPGTLSRLLGWPGEPAVTASPSGREARDTTDSPTDDAWGEVERSRATDRPRARAFLAALDIAVELHGDRAGTDDPAIRVVLARLAGRPVVVVAMDRDAAEGRPTPGGYRKAWRGTALAERLGVPLVTLIDTPGADASAASEAGGIANHIARTFLRLLELRAPVVSLVVGEGGSGGALALAVGDRLLIQEHAIFSVIAPEGAAAILHRDPGKAADVTPLLDPTADRLRRLGIADAVIPEPGGREVETALEAVARTLDDLAGEDLTALRSRRRARWRTAGQR